MPMRWSYPYIRVTERWPNRRCPRSGGPAPLTFSSLTGLHLPDDELSPPREGDGGWFPRREKPVLSASNGTHRGTFSAFTGRRSQQRPPDELVGLFPMPGLRPHPRAV